MTFRVPCGFKFSPNFLFFEFRGNKFLRNWISDSAHRNNYLWILVWYFRWPIFVNRTIAIRASSLICKTALKYRVELKSKFSQRQQTLNCTVIIAIKENTIRLVVFVTLSAIQPISLKFSKVNKRSKFSRNYIRRKFHAPRYTYSQGNEASCVVKVAKLSSERRSCDRLTCSEKSFVRRVINNQDEGLFWKSRFLVVCNFPC